MAKSWKRLPELPASREEAERIVWQLWWNRGGRRLRRAFRSPEAAIHHLTKKILREKYGYRWGRDGVHRSDAEN